MWIFKIRLPVTVTAWPLSVACRASGLGYRLFPVRNEIRMLSPTASAEWIETSNNDNLHITFPWSARTNASFHSWVLVAGDCIRRKTCGDMVMM